MKYRANKIFHIKWQRRDIEDDLKFMALKAARAWDKTCRKEAKKARKPLGEKSGKRVFAGRFHVRRPIVNKGKAKETPTVPEANAEAPATTTATETPSRGASLRARVGAVRDKARRKQPAEEGAQTEKKKRGGTRAGKAAILCVPCVSVARRVKHRKNRDETNSASAGDQQVRTEEGDAAGRRTMRQRFSARHDAAKRGPSTGSGALWNRFGSRKAKQGSTGNGAVDEGPSLGMMDRSAEGEAQATSGVEGQAGGEADTSQPKKSKAARLVAIPAGLAAAIGAAIKNRRRGTQKTTPATSEEGSATATTSETQKTSKFSALKARIRALRTKVTKKRSSSGTRDYFRELKEKRKSNTKEKDVNTANAGPKNVKEHGAIVGVVAACFAMPAEKVRELRNKHREGQTETASSAPPVATETLEASSAALDPNSRSVIQQPIPEENEDGRLEQPSPPGTTQYLPGHGQSEIPVAGAVEAGRPQSEPRLGSAETAVEQTQDTAQVEQPAQPTAASPAAAVRFRSIRDGIGSLKPRKTASEPAGQTAADEAREIPTNDEPATPTAGRFQSFKDGIGNLRPKKRAEVEAPHPEGPMGPVGGENATEDTPLGADDAPRERRYQSIMDGFGNLKPKKTVTEEPAKQKVYKDSHKSGFMDRMRWIWYVA